MTRDLKKIAAVLLIFSMSGCASVSIFDPLAEADKAVVFSSIELSFNRVRGTTLERIDGQHAQFTKNPPWKIAFADTKREQTAWIIPPGNHELTIKYTDKAVSIGSKHEALVVVSVKLLAGGHYVPTVRIDGDEVEVSLVDPRNSNVIAGPVRTPIQSGAVIPLFW